MSNGKVQTMFPDFAPRLSEAAARTHAAASPSGRAHPRLPRASNLQCTALPVTDTGHLDNTLSDPGVRLEAGLVAGEPCWLRLERWGRLLDCGNGGRKVLAAVCSGLGRERRRRSGEVSIFVNIVKHAAVFDPF